ncbi:MAG: (d)CMP kinase [Thermoleophilia bacterium]|nr:(d)CMP kinase [Thermoleophilia bacterium]
MVIAIDGPAGAGKSSVARALSEAIGFTYLDSGAMYRCVAFEVLRRDLDPGDSAAATSVAETVQIGFTAGGVSLDGVEAEPLIRAPEVTEAASRVSVHPGVRAALVAEQRRLISEGRYVAEGRDIGTVVSPDSPLKVFLTATPEERARRRAVQTGGDARQILASQNDRDRRDSEREIGALRTAEDAVTVDTTDRTLDQVVDAIAGLARGRGLA